MENHATYPKKKKYEKNEKNHAIYQKKKNLKKITGPLQICIGPTIRIARESWCLPYAEFFFETLNVTQKKA